MHQSSRATVWREHAEILRKYKQVSLAELLEELAEELEADEVARASARVDLEDAVAITGYTRGHLRRMIATGQLSNLGTDEKPEFLLASLPRKPGYGTANKKLASSDEDAADYTWQVARARLFGE